VHILIDLLSVEAGSDDGLRSLGEAIGNAVSLKTTSLAYDHYRPTPDGGVSVKPQRTRCRFAQRFGESDSEDGSEKTREGALRDAFNSPFGPFILASTSIGQEGLDFHPYCHALVHWNLPTNPVDLEQREGLRQYERVETKRRLTNTRSDGDHCFGEVEREGRVRWLVGKPRRSRLSIAARPPGGRLKRTQLPSIEDARMGERAQQPVCKIAVGLDKTGELLLGGGGLPGRPK
jgi:hypothetical protein